MQTSENYSVRDPNNLKVKLRDDLIISPRISGDTSYYVVEDPLRGKFYRLGVPEYTFVSLLDGKMTIAEALGQAAVKLGRLALAEQESLALCRWLLDCQLAQTDESVEASNVYESAEKISERSLLGYLNPLMIKLPLMNPDRTLTTMLPWTGWILSWPFFIVWLATCLYGIYLAAADWSHIASSTRVILDQDNWLRLMVAWVLLKILHEFAHGLACKKFGGTVPSAGITVIFFAPLAYVNVTSSWRFRSKWHRSLTAIAGMYVELFAAAIAVFVWTNTSPGVAHQLAFNVAMMAGVNTLIFNGNPLVRFDGYFIVSDLLEIPNLYSYSQQSLMELVEKFFAGHEPPASPFPPHKVLALRIYAIAAVVWKIVFFLGMALALVGMLSQLGVLLATLLLSLGLVLPAIKLVVRLFSDRAAHAVNKRRLLITAASCAALSVAAILLLIRPSTVQSPAVIEYSPLTIIRATAPGFVREIRVRSGDLVEAGQVIAVLENRELAAELADLELALQQSLLKGRMYRKDEQLAKCEVEQGNRIAIEKRLKELRERIANLTVRTPVGGRVCGDDVQSLTGRYLPLGGEIAAIGGEKTKELLIAVEQDDVDMFLACIGQMIGVRTRPGNREALQARLTKVDPSGSMELPHPAMAAPVGGPLAVKTKPASEHDSDKKKKGFELLNPVFLAKAELPPEESQRVHAGQLAFISFRSPTDTVAGRLVKSVQRWMQRKMDQRRG